MTRYCVDSEDQSTWALPRQHLRATTRAFACLALLLTIALPAAANEEPVRELLVDWANTSEEHTASARYYDEKAKEARREVVRHGEMGARYAEGNMKSRGDQTLHCERIAALNRQLASEYEALAQNHREEASRRKQEADDRTQ